MAGHVLHGNGDVRKGCATVAVKASVAEGVASSKCGCIAGWKTAVHSAGGGCGGAVVVCKLYYQKKDAQSFRSAVVPVKIRRLYCCLLYTSPSPRDKRQSRMPSSA